MDLATKSRNTSGFVKFIVILLSVVTMFGAFQSGVPLIDFAGHYGEKTLDALRGENVTSMSSDKVRTSAVGIANCLVEISSMGETELNEEVFNKLYRVDDDYYYYNDYAYYTQYTSALRYYIVNNKTNTVLTNFKKEDNYKTILKDKEYAFACISGVTKQTTNLGNNYSLVFDDYIDAYFYFDVLANGYYNGEIRVEDIVANDINSAYELSSINVKTKAILAILLAFISICLAVYAMMICGNRDRNGKVKPMFLDYVPLDIHLAITSGLVALGAFLIFLLADEADIGEYSLTSTTNLRFWIYTGISASASAIQLLVIEFMTSFIRICRGTRRWYKTSLITFICYVLVKIGIKLHKILKRNRESIKQYLGYKPEAFKRRIILFLIGYGILNIFFMIMSFVWANYASFDSDEAPAILNGLCWFALNVVSVGFVTKYIVNLDKIISSAHNRTIPNVNYQKLPKSLKMLVDSMQYTNQELTNAVAKAVKDERMRTELITNVSHDLKTPLTSIINYVDLLKACDIQDENAREYIAVLDEKGIKLKRLIEDLLEASKVTSGVINLNPVNLDLGELATQAVVEHQQEFVENHLELVFKGDKRSTYAFADGNKTFRVIENLLSNARKYSAKGSRVYADVFEQNNTAIFEIKNISAEPLDISADELKERFVRGDKSRTNEGNGLGLSIADSLCKAMNGRLELVIDGDLFKARVILPKNK